MVGAVVPKSAVLAVSEAPLETGPSASCRKSSGTAMMICCRQKQGRTACAQMLEKGALC